MPKLNLKQHLLAPRETPNHKARVQAVERNLINADFCLKKNVWIWYEDGVTIRYEVRKNGVYKKVGEEEYYKKIEGAELTNFKNATKAYLKLIKQSIYQ